MNNNNTEIIQEKLAYASQNTPPTRTFFHKYGKSAHDSQCTKSRLLTKVIDKIIYIDSFEHKCVIIKGLLHSERLKQHIIFIGVDQ